MGPPVLAKKPSSHVDHCVIPAKAAIPSSKSNALYAMSIVTGPNTEAASQFIEPMTIKSPPTSVQLTISK